MGLWFYESPYPSYSLKKITTQLLSRFHLTVLSRRFWTLGMHRLRLDIDVPGYINVLANITWNWIPTVSLIQFTNIWTASIRGTLLSAISFFHDNTSLFNQSKLVGVYEFLYKNWGMKSLIFYSTSAFNYAGWNTVRIPKVDNRNVCYEFRNIVAWIWSKWIIIIIICQIIRICQGDKILIKMRPPM